MKIMFYDLEITLLPSGGLFLEKENLLVVSDTHFGKILALSDQGIPIPRNSDEKTLSKLELDIQYTKATTCLFLGDIIHEKSNALPNFLAQLDQNLNNIDIILTLGNHDKDIQFPSRWQCCKTYSISNVCLSHEPINNIPCIAGHIHAGIIIKKGRFKQRKKAFLLQDRCLLCPGYGEYTGVTSKKIHYKQAYILEKGVVKQY